MNKKALEVLEYNKIIGLLIKECGCDMSRAMAERLRPGSEIRDIRDELRSTTEAVDLIVHKGPLPSGGIYNVSRDVKAARKGLSLYPKQLLQIRYNLFAAGSVRNFMETDVPETKIIKELTDLLVPCRELVADIDRCIISEDEISDNASPELRRLRREIVSQNDAIRNKLTKMVSGKNTYLQDSIVTIRDGRYVIPVKAEHRSSVPGIVHDQSKGGSTLFIEPQVIVDMNNRLKELELAEETEVARILQALSDRVGEHHDEIINDQKLLTQLDFIMAKGKLSLSMGGSEPELGEDGQLELKSARHPLLDKEKAVPVSVTLGEEFRTLVITGPNTGGKTVTLKTIGLLTLMALSGLHIPAAEGSRIPVYDDVFADIGDEQSIEQSLSTFSSHMKNIVFITNHAGSNTLVLVDELGAGTDPTEGAALAIAILERLYELGSYTVATTHYNEIKKYALSTPGVENACMEFDVKTLSPTYHLLVGVPGKSNAFDISRKLGLPRIITQRAKDIIENDDMKFEDVITKIDNDRHRAEQDRREAAKMAADIREQHEKVSRESEDLSKNKEKILAEARRQARDIIRDAKETADEVRKSLRGISNGMTVAERNKAFEEQNRKLNEKSEKYQEHLVRHINSEPVDVRALKAGDTVKVLSLGQNGVILNVKDAGSILVQVGAVKMTLKAKDIAVVTDGSKKSLARRNEMRKASINIARSKALSVSASTDVRGQNLFDAQTDVEKYIDDAYIAGMHEVTIIHGRGEGILKSGIRKALLKNKHVDSIRPGAYNEGGEGVTIVTLKK